MISFAYFMAFWICQNRIKFTKTNAKGVILEVAVLDISGSVNNDAYIL